MNPEKEKIPLRKYAIYRHYKGGDYTRTVENILGR